MIARYGSVRRPCAFPTTDDPWLLPVLCEGCGRSGWRDRRVGTVAHGYAVCVVQAVEWPAGRTEAKAA